MIKISRIVYLIIILSVCLNAKIYAEEMDHSAYGAIFLKEGKFVRQTTFIGFKCGWVIDNSFVIGVEFYRFLNPFSTGLLDTISKTYPKFDFSTGGIYFEYIFLSNKFIHGSVSMLCGAGGLSYLPENTGIPHLTYISNNLSVWEPELHIECNLLTWLHLGLGAGYRYVPNDLGYYNINLEEFSGFNWIITLKLGKY